MRWILVGAIALLSMAGRPARADDDAQARAQKFYEVGKLHIEAKEYALAAVNIKRAYEIYPLPELAYNLAQVYRLDNHKQLAGKWYQTYLSEVSRGPAADDARKHLLEFGLDALAAENCEAARDWFQIARKWADTSDTNYYLGKSFACLGERERATPGLERFLELADDSDDRRAEVSALLASWKPERVDPTDGDNNSLHIESGRPAETRSGRGPWRTLTLVGGAVTALGFVGATITFVNVRNAQDRKDAVVADVLEALVSQSDFDADSFGADACRETARIGDRSNPDVGELLDACDDGQRGQNLHNFVFVPVTVLAGVVSGYFAYRWLTEPDAAVSVVPVATPHGASMGVSVRF